MTRGKASHGWRQILEQCGLRVVPGGAPLDAPPINEAIYAVTGIEVQPTAVVPVAASRAGDELDEKWHQHASASSFYGNRGEFLILPPVSGGSGIGWVEVIDPIGEHLPSRIAAVAGSPEFLAVSHDGRRLCAVSVEDDEYWVLLHKFS
ncbi:hypothetical protein [Streptomyces collinus]|uniref:hypothetical protein n=1 Tax=Streptomyces collinus TaxID=42684 RepID=UPI003447646B